MGDADKATEAEIRQRRDELIKKVLAAKAPAEKRQRQELIKKVLADKVTAEEHQRRDELIEKVLQIRKPRKEIAGTGGRAETKKCDANPDSKKP